MKNTTVEFQPRFVDDGVDFSQRHHEKAEQRCRHLIGGMFVRVHFDLKTDVLLWGRVASAVEI